MKTIKDLNLGNKGFSLLEVTIAAGLSSIIGLMVMTTIEQGKRENKKSVDRLEALAHIGIVRSAFDSDALCDNALLCVCQSHRANCDCQSDET